MAPDLRQKMWAFGGGKGGVGKSLIALMLSAWLGKLGARVILLDADLGGANLHTLLGIRYPQATLDDFISRRVENLERVVLDTELPNVRLISGADDILGLANPKWAQKMRLLRHIDDLDADFIMLDLGAGTGFNALDFFMYSGNRVAVFAPQATSVQNAYGYIKSSLFRRIGQLLGRDPEAAELVKGLIEPDNCDPRLRTDSVPALQIKLKKVAPKAHEKLRAELASWQVRLVANMVRSKQRNETVKVLRHVASNFLGLELSLMGEISYDTEIERNINKLVPLLKGGASSQAVMGAYAIANEMLKAARLAGVKAA
ncbi:MAG: P-loop NTPase [Pseudomonadota bacterium]